MDDLAELNTHIQHLRTIDTFANIGIAINSCAVSTENTGLIFNTLCAVFTTTIYVCFILVFHAIIATWNYSIKVSIYKVLQYQFYLCKYSSCNNRFYSHYLSHMNDLKNIVYTVVHHSLHPFHLDFVFHRYKTKLKSTFFHVSPTDRSFSPRQTKSAQMFVRQSDAT